MPRTKSRQREKVKSFSVTYLKYEKKSSTKEPKFVAMNVVVI